MPPDREEVNESSKLLGHAPKNHRLSLVVAEDDVASLIDSNVSKDEQALSSSTVGERLPYNDYTTIDWLHDLVKDSYRYRSIHSGRGIRRRLWSAFDSCSGWIVAALIGIITAVVAFLVDVATAVVSDWKLGYCKGHPFATRERCCTIHPPLSTLSLDEDCTDWKAWSSGWYGSFGIYVGWALAFGVLSSSLTMLTKSSLSAASPGQGDKGDVQSQDPLSTPARTGKSIYLAAGSGIPEIKTILSGFVIPHILDLKVLIVKAVGAVLAVATGMCLGKEGPFVHISTCVSNLVAKRFPKYRDNDRKMREMLSAGCSSGLSVAFGAPIGGVLFSYEEISTYFPRKVLWRAFFCSLWAAGVLRALNPTGTGKLVLFETKYGTLYSPIHYLIFVLLGIAGGVWGGTFCKLNFLWSKSFRKLSIIKNYPVFEVFLVVLVTALLQFPNPMTRDPGDITIKNLLQDCQHREDANSWLCQQEATPSSRPAYIGWLVYGTLVKLVLTIITFGCKVPSGIIIPALDAGAFFGRLVGQGIGGISPGIFAMVGAAAFLAGVSRMTISLAVIMFELTGELEYVVPDMIAILVAKWVADALEKNGVYDLAQTVLGHPFLDPDHAMHNVRREGALVEAILPPRQTMVDITVDISSGGTEQHPDGCVPRRVLQEKLDKLKARGLLDAGLVLVQHGMLQGYLAEGELEFGLTQLGATTQMSGSHYVRLLHRWGPDAGGAEEEGRDHYGGPYRDADGDTWNTTADGGETGAGAGMNGAAASVAHAHAADADPDILDLTAFVDRTPLTISAKAPMEYAVEMFGKLGLRHLCVVEEGSGRLVGVIIKKRLVSYLEGLH